MDTRLERIKSKFSSRLTNKYSEAFIDGSAYNLELIHEFTKDDAEVRKDYFRRGVLVRQAHFINLYSDRQVPIYDYTPKMLEYNLREYYRRQLIGRLERETVRKIMWTIYEFIDYVYEKHKDLEINGVKVYDRRKPNYFIKVRDYAPYHRRKHLLEEEYNRIMNVLDDKGLIMHKAILSLMYETGMDSEDIITLESNIINGMPNDDGYYLTQIFENEEGKKYRYLISPQVYEYLEDWLYNKPDYTSMVFGSKTGHVEETMTLHWVNLKWELDFLPLMKDDMSHRSMEHDFCRVFIDNN